MTSSCVCVQNTPNAAHGDDVQILMHQVGCRGPASCGQQPQPSTSFAPQKPMSPVSPQVRPQVRPLPQPARPPTKKRCLAQKHGEGKVPVLEEVAIDFIKNIQSRSHVQDPNVNYAQTVADRLGQIKDARRLAVLKMNIDKIIHEAVMEEME